MKQYSCSELLVDFKITDPDEMFKLLERMTKKYDWNWEPKLTKENVRKVKETQNDSWENKVFLKAYDSEGNYITLRFGHNGYMQHRYYFDADQHCVTRNFPFLDKALLEFNKSELYAHDGGSTFQFEDWREENKV